jgi:putative transposon-encoded protein
MRTEHFIKYILSIYFMVDKLNPKTKITIENIEGMLQKTVTAFGNGAKVDCLKEYIGRPAYIIICKENPKNKKKTKKS